MSEAIAAIDAELARTADARLAELVELLRIPSISALSAHRDDVRNGATWLAEHLTLAGLEHVEVSETPGHPVVYANDNFAHWRADFRELVAMAAASGSTGQAVSALLQPCPQDYFVLKPKHSAFLATALPVLLGKLRVDTLFLTGMTADSCILATALDGNAREYRVRVVRDAVAALPQRKRQALSLIASSRAGSVVSSRQVLREGS